MPRGHRDRIGDILAAGDTVAFVVDDDQVVLAMGTGPDVIAAQER